jgi:RHS repeat-associated protein
VRQFDAAGNLAWVAPGTALNTLACDASAAPEQRRIRYEYDTRNRLRWARQGDGNGQIERTYKADGLLERITSYRTGRNTLTWAYEYHNSRELKEERHTWGDPANFWSWFYQVDPRRQRRSYADAYGEVALDPDALGRPRRMGGYASNVSYHPDGSVAGYVLGNGITFRTTPDAFGRPEVWEHVGRSRQTYSYDPVGNVTSIDDAVDPMRSVSLPNYDLLDRLRQANGPWQRGSQQGGLFEYDGLDNIVRSTVGSRTLEHGMDRVRNRLSQLTGSQNLDFEYDSNGNITRRGNTYFTFDIANRMLSSTAHTGLDYDGHGRRTKTWMVGGALRHTGYTQDGLLRRDWRTGQGGRRYIYLGGKLIAEQRDGSFGNEVTYSHADVLGSPMLRTNAAGAVVQTTVHEPYGATAAGWDVPPRVGYTGHVNDPETGLVYMQQRYYDPIAGRFLSLDPVTTNAKDGSFFNRYEYAESNPYKYIDPDGRQADCTGTRISGGCASGGGVAFSHSGGSTHYGDGGGASQSSRTNNGVAGSGLQPNSGASRTLGSYLPGTDAGDSAAQYWANKHVETGNGLYMIPGLLASLWTPNTAAETATTLLTAGTGSVGVRLGREITFGKNVRIAPFGNRTGHPQGELPHYHRRGVDPITGETKPGQGVGRHRPWETKSTDKSFWDRF